MNFSNFRKFLSIFQRYILSMIKYKDITIFLQSLKYLCVLGSLLVCGLIIQFYYTIKIKANIMIKYIQERYSNINQNQQQKMNDNPEEQNVQTNQSTVALKNLKLAQDHLDAMKRRLSVLQIKQDKYNKRVAENERKLNFHAQVQDSISKDRRRKMKYLQKVQKQLDNSKSRIKLQRQLHQQHYQAAIQDLSANKRAQYQRVKATSQLIEKNLHQFKQSDRQQKISKKNSIKNYEKKQRENVAEYFLQKRNNFRENSAREGSRYDSQRSEREKMLGQLSAMESKLLYNQSVSRAALDDSNIKLQKIIVKPTINTRTTRQKSTQINSQRLPYITSRNQEEYLIL